jgi:polyisoprenyl-teichoic acid--peptidoglycan teichoic acid transferase
MNSAQIGYPYKQKFYKRKWFKVFVIILALFLIAGGTMAWKTGYILNKISTKGGILKSLVHAIPGVGEKLKGEDESRINILLLGMRGENVPGGGLLADTIMVASVNLKENKVAMISIPRDLYVDNPEWGAKTKINAVYAAGEENGKKQGIADMEKVVSDVSGIPIHYAITINFAGFKQLIDAIGGIEITLNQPFSESLQFNQEHVCDGDKGGVFTIPTGKYEYKKNEKGKIVAQYPICANENAECNGEFTLPAGKNKLTGEQALCYVRSRYSTNDFERAKRQQIVIQTIKDKALSIGTLADFGKVNGIINALGDNVRTDMELWELQHLFTLYQKMPNPQIYQRVLENTEEGLLYNPPETPEAGYILLPRGDNYDKIHNLFQNIFTLPVQSDIKPK